MEQDGFFDGLAESRGPARATGKARLREPVRDQISLQAVDLDSVIGTDHPARVIWAYVEKLDLSALEGAIKSREGTRGHPAIAPRLMLGLWLYGTSQGVGSARELARLCLSEDGYRWMCGGVSVNYHTLADFRMEQSSLLDRLLTENVAALVAAGLIDLSILAQDGIKVRAGAGSSSFRRRGTLEKHLEQARALVTALKKEVHDDPAASRNRVRAARERAARERTERIEEALKQLVEVEKVRKKRETKNANQTKKQKEPRASTTDPEARVMKMANGGFNPAYNVQVVSTAGEQIVIMVDPLNIGSDRGQIRPALEEVRRRTGNLPESCLQDGGFLSGPDIEWAHREGVAIYCPPTKSKHGGDPLAPRKDDGPGMTVWRERMGEDGTKEIYKDRSICECIHARWRNWNLNRFTVRGREKVKAVMLWHALANNILQAVRLERQARESVAATG